MTIFDDWTLEQAREATGEVDAGAKASLSFYNGDHWQNGDGWTGPRPLANEVDFATTMDLIRLAFVSKNVIREITDRHVNGILGRTLHWKFTVTRALGQAGDQVLAEDGSPVLDAAGQPLTLAEDEQPTPEEQALIGEAEAALVQWWDDQDAQSILQYATAMMLATRRGLLRLYVPPGIRDEAGDVPAGNLTEQLGRIHLWPLGLDEDALTLSPAQARVYTEKRTRQRVGVWLYTEDGHERCELSYVDDAGNTVIRILGGADDERVELPLGGNLALHEMTRPALVTEQIRSQQKALNKAKTMSSRNQDQGGFLERILLNAQLPGHYETDAYGNKRFIPDPLQMGAGTTNALMGVTYEDESGNQRIATPSVVYRDPVPPTTFIEAERALYRDMLEEANQLHYLTSGDAAASGESRRQARGDYEQDLLLTAGKVEAACRWLLETALAMSAVFAGTPGRFASLRATVQARVHGGPISADEMRVAREMVDARLWSREYGMSYTGIEDVDAEMDRIEREQGQAGSLADVEALLGLMGQGAGGEV